MPEADTPLRIARIALKPRIVVRGEAPADERLHALAATAHRECFIANSLRSEIVLEPRFERVEL